MAGNTSPIYSRVGDIQGGDVLTTAAAEFTGQSINNVVVFEADEVNGGFIQRLRFKAAGTNVATTARIFFNNGSSRIAATIAAPTGTPTGTPSASGGTLQTGTYFCKIVAIDQYGGKTVAGTESASVSVTGPTGSIVWNWTAVTSAVKYRVYVGPLTGTQITYFESLTNSYTQIAAVGTRDSLSTSINNNNALIGEISLPATSVTTTSASAGVDIDYPLNFALPPSGRIIVGLSVTVAGGWVVTGVGGAY